MCGHIHVLHDDLCAREDPGLLHRVGTRQAGGRGEHHDQPGRVGPLEVDAVELGGHGPTALGRRLGPSAPYDDRARPSETLAGFLASAAIFVSLMGLAYRPLRLIPFAILLALIAAGIGGRFARLATIATAICAACFALGLAIAVITSSPLW